MIWQIFDCEQRQVLPSYDEVKHGFITWILISDFGLDQWGQFQQPIITKWSIKTVA